MATKKGQLASELTNDKEWKEFIRRPGLLVVDLFSDWAGPCVAMNTPLRTLKTSDLAYDWLHLATAPTSIVPALKRLDGTSRPTFVLLSGARLVNVIFGCNAPRVIETIKAELEREVRVAAGQERRATMSLTRMCPAEQEMHAERLAAEGEEEARQAEEAGRVLRTIFVQIANNLPGVTVVVVFPYALQAEHCGSVLRQLRNTWTESGLSVIREEHLELTTEAVDLMFWERRLPQHDILVESVIQGASLVLMLERPSEDEDEEEEEEEKEDVEEEESAWISPEAIVARSIYGFLPGTGSSMEFIRPAESVSPLEEEEDMEEGALIFEESVQKPTGVDTTDADQPRADLEESPLNPVDSGQRLTDEETSGAAGTDVVEQAHDPDDEQEDQTAEPAAETGSRGEDVDGQAGQRKPEGIATKKREDVADQAESAENPVGVAAPQGNGGESGKGSRDEELGEREGPLTGSIGGLGSPARMWNPRELLPALDSPAARLLLRPDESGPALPGIWTPLNPMAKAAAVMALFPRMAEQLYTPPSPPPPPPPPMSVVFFGGDKREEVLDLAASFPGEVTRYGFFTRSRKLLASSRQDYDKLVRGGLQAAKTLLVLEVARVRSAPLLELSTAGPQYVSATPAIAKNDIEDFFGTRCTSATLDDVREITKVVEHIPETEDLPEQTASPRSSGTQPEEPMQGEIAPEPALVEEHAAEPTPLLLEAGEGGPAAVDEFQASGVLDVGEGDAPATGEVDALATMEE